jgi:hypothetical protein
MAIENRTVTLNGVEFTLGQKYRDIILGVEGVAVASATYMTGCDQIQLAACDANGMPYSQWFDVTRIEGVEVEKRPGGPEPMIPARHPG